MISLVASGLVAGLVAAPPADARYATGGTGTYRGAIDWFEWGTRGEAIPGAGLTRTNTRTVAGQQLATTCTLGPVSGGSLTAYASGGWREDGLDDMYNIGGTGAANQLVAGLATANGQTVGFDFSCSAALDGVPVPLAGLVMADAEASGTSGGEYVQATIGTGRWRVIDRYRSPGCTQSTPVTLTGGTLRLGGIPNGSGCSTFPTTVAFMEGATAADVVVKGGGVSAIALGVMLAADFGDAPASYGEAGALYSTTFSGGVVPAGDSSAFALDLATPGQPTPRLGATVDSEGASQPGEGATADGPDEDAIAAPGPALVTPGGSWTLPDVMCSGPGTVAAWLDWNRDGAFDAGERSALAPCDGGSVALTWTVPGDAQEGATYLRLRIAADAAAVADAPTGMTTSGEVEDYALDVELPALTLTKGSTATDDTRPGDVVTYTVTATNDTEIAFTEAYPAVVLDDLTGVLDDAAFGGEATASVGVQPSYTKPILAWSGPLAAGASVTLAYDVVITADGDGTARNVAFAPRCAPGDPGCPPPPTPSCAETGVDPDSGLPCATTSQDLPRLSITKTADTTELPAIGETVTYAVTVTNEGPGSYTASAPATASDDWSDVLDDAELTGTPVTSTGSTTLTDTGFVWSGALAAGDSATIAATFRYTGDGDQVLANSACVPADERAPGAPGCVTVETPGSALSYSKTAQPGTGPVLAGQDVTYTLTFTNTGEAPAAVDATDALADVLDDAELAGGPAVSDAALTATLENTDLRVTGALPVGATVTVRYTVRVLPWGDQGDHVLENAVTDAGGVCADECTTVHEVAHLDVTKASDATAATRPGDRVRYTVTARNAGTGDFTAAVPAVLVDDLAGVLDDATLDVGSVEASRDGDLAVAAPTIAWSGALATGDTVTLTYVVTLTGGAEGGDGVVRNVAFAPGCDPADPGCVVETPACDPPAGGVDAATDVPCAASELELPRLSITKVADTAALPAIGATVTYTVTVTNAGPGDYTPGAPASFTDDLAEVLDDATLDEASITASVGQASFADGDLAWAGVLVADASATVRYTLTYTGAGDHDLTNAACVPADQALPDAEACASVVVRGADLTFAKSADPASGASVLPGQDVTYTLTFTSAGSAAAAVDATDALADVLDDGTLVTDSVTVSDPALSAAVEGTDLRVTGSLPVGATVTVSYTVTVLPWAEQGDHVLANSVADAGGTCADACATTHGVPHLTVTKASDATGDSRPGDVVRYTVTARNTGTGDYTGDDPAVFLDDLAGVLDDAILDVASVEADKDGGTLDADAPTLGWAGALAQGEAVRLTYAVTLTGDGDGVVRNVAFAAPCDPADPGCVVVTPDCDPATGGADPATGVPCAVAESELPALTITKSADRSELPAIGEPVTYTLTVTNTGPGDYTPGAPATATDDLSFVLDDATLDEGSVTASVGDAVVDGSELSWTGVLRTGEAATISYTVTYTAAGDQALTNAACVPADHAAPGTEPCVTVRTPGSGLTFAKASDPPAGAPVMPGQDVTYTLTFANTGKAAATVDATDTLVGVLDDADLAAGPVASDGALAVDLDGAVLSVTGSLEPGETRTVSYTVTVRDWAERGDGVLGNVVADPGGICAVTGCTTVHQVQHLSVAKSSGAATADTGDTVTYTVTITNDGESDFTAENPATATDDLTGVLDDAALDGKASADVGRVKVADGVLTWTGPLAAGESATLTYAVTVTNGGDHRLVNVAGLAPDLCAQGEDCTATVTTPLPHVVPGKSSDPASGTGLQAGQVVTYTLTFTNDGLAPGPVDATDDLAGVLDDAAVTGEPVSDHRAVTATRTGAELRVVGELPAGETATVTYRVTIGADGERGDNVVGNVLAPDVPQVVCEEAGDTRATTCVPVDPPRTEHPIGQLDDWKTVDPASGATVRPGREVTYALHFANVGTAPVDVAREDVLAGVLDDADLVRGPVASSGEGGALAVSDVADGRFAVTGTLGAGQTVTVRYAVVVRAHGERGDDRLGNVLVDQGAEPPEQCVPADDERPDCTVNHVSDVVVTKSADRDDGTRVATGDEVTYTLTFTNVSTDDAAAPADVDWTDHLAGVLDDAELAGRPHVRGDALEARVDGETIRVVGALAPGEEVTVSYAVTVAQHAEQGDHVLENVVAMTGTRPVCAEGSDLCTSHPTVEPTPGGGRPPLPVTGATAGGLAGVAAILLLLGALTLAAVRRHGSDR